MYCSFHTNSTTVFNEKKKLEYPKFTTELPCLIIYYLAAQITLQQQWTKNETFSFL